MNCNNDILIEMAEKINLVDYAAQTCDLRRSGNNYFTSCFLHNEKTPSLCISAEKNLWHCFGCGCGGNIYNWIMKYDGVDFQEAVNKVALLTGTNPESIIESETVKVYKTLNYHGQFDQNAQPERVIQDFENDYINKYSDELPQVWIDEGILPEVMDKFNIRIDKKSNRIVYPLYDEYGNYIATKGRSLLDLETIKLLKIPKYITFSKIDTVDFFCGIKENYDNIQRVNKVIVFEGIKSVMHVIPWGYDYGVSSETNHLNDNQIKILIKLGVKEVIIAYDKGVLLKDILPQVEMLRKFTKVSIVMDRWNLLNDKDSPCDKGREVFDTLFKKRIVLN